MSIRTPRHGGRPDESWSHLTGQPEPRFYVHDKKNGSFSAINPRYAVVDRTTNQIVDELASARAAQDTADIMNAQAE